MRVVEVIEFHDLLLFVSDHLVDADIPKRTQIAKLIADTFVGEYSKIAVDAQVSFSFVHSVTHTS